MIMGARDTILKAVADNKPELTGLPDMDLSMTIQYPDLVRQFVGMVESAGGKAYCQNSREDLLTDLTQVKAEGKFMINLLESPLSMEWGNQNASDLESLDTLFLRAELGVAENGAMWISEKQMANRLLPFICQHLVIVLNQGDLVHNMHEAYQQLDAVSEGFGVFIAGPSKTADIEQNLVIGAHGSRSMRVYLL